MIMKNTIMLAIIIAGVLTAVYRFLPADAQHRIDMQVQTAAQAQHLVHIPTKSEPKKYALVIPDERALAQPVNNSVVASAYIQHLQDIQVQGEGRVVKVLSDDTDGSKHQRFILRTPEDVTVLIAHNIDLAPRIQNLTLGDTVYFSGEYVWNEKGGLVHWTHRDPRGRHVSGWLKHNGITYQ
jgi:hypothetical protein